MKFVSTNEAMRLLGCHRNTIWNLVRKGKLRMYKDYRGYGLFNMDEVMALRDERKKIEEVRKS